VDGVMRDFRATRFNFQSAALQADDGRQLRVISDGRQHAQAVPIHGDLEGDTFTAEMHGSRRPGYFLTIPTSTAVEPSAT
jgi:hypothetical protein